MQRLDARKEKIGSASDGGKRREADDFLPDRPLGNLVFEGAVVVANNRVALVLQLVKVPVVDPHVLRELELANQARAPDERRDAPLESVFRRTFRKRRPVRASTPDHPAAIHVRGRIAGIHPSHVRPERRRVTVWILLRVIEIVVPLRIRAKRRVVVLWREHQRSAAAPATHQLRRDKLLLFWCVPMLAKKIPERTHVLFEPAVGQIAAVA